MFIYENFKKAEDIVLSSIDIPTYYKMFINQSEDLFRTHVNCPIHDDSTASFQYHENTDTFFCFGCQRGGNVVVLHRYIMKGDLGEEDDEEGGVTYSRALLDLARKLKIKIPSFYEIDTVREVIIPQKLPDYSSIKLPYKYIRTKVNSYLQKIKKTDFKRFIDICELLDSMEYAMYSEQDKKKVLQTLCDKYSI